MNSLIQIEKPIQRLLIERFLNDVDREIFNQGIDFTNQMAETEAEFKNSPPKSYEYLRRTILSGNDLNTEIMKSEIRIESEINKGSVFYYCYFLPTGKNFN